MADPIKTEFNSSAATLQRVDESLRGAGNCYFKGDLDGWYKYLNLLKGEAWVKMDDKEREECTERFNLLTNLVSIYSSSIQGRKVIKPQLIGKLQNTEFFLRDVMDEHGMLMHNKDDYRGL